MADIEDIISNIESDDFDCEEYALHKYLELATAMTGLGEVVKDYTKMINFPIGAAWIASDPYYQRVTMTSDDVETDIEDQKTIKELSDELKKRLLEFDKRIEKTRTELAEEIFNRQIKHIVDLEEDDEDEDENEEKEVE